jgi:hypothetical protein
MFCKGTIGTKIIGENLHKAFVGNGTEIVLIKKQSLNSYKIPLKYYKKHNILTEFAKDVL